eukprot:1590320-Rhodomonas_salina.2
MQCSVLSDEEGGAEAAAGEEEEGGEEEDGGWREEVRGMIQQALRDVQPSSASACAAPVLRAAELGCSRV